MWDMLPVDVVLAVNLEYPPLLCVGEGHAAEDGCIGPNEHLLASGD